jgi:hypothetical protein
MKLKKEKARGRTKYKVPSFHKELEMYIILYLLSLRKPIYKLELL